jgi:DNA-binding transcriptional MerR regulator
VAATSTLIGANIGKGLGEFANATNLVPTVADLAKEGTAGAVNVAGKSITQATKVTFNVAEKMMVATIIVICIILLFIGLSLLLNDYWKSGGLMTLFGLGGAVGAMYWFRNPASNSILGGDEMYESEPVVDMDHDFESTEGDMSYIVPTYEGSHEDTMLSDLERILSVLESEDRETELSEIKKSIEECGAETESVMKSIADVIDKTLDKKEEVKAMYDRLKDEEKEEVKNLLEEIRKLSNEVKEKSHNIDGKLLELINAL